MRKLPMSKTYQDFMFKDYKKEFKEMREKFAKAQKEGLSHVIFARVKCIHCGFNGAPIPIPYPGIYTCSRCDQTLFGCKKEVVFFHGGQRDLKVGEFLLPSSQTGAKNTLVKYIEEMTKEKGIRNTSNPDVVYLTTSYDAALLYAVLHPSGGQVYKVKPVGDVERDEDCKVEGLSYGCLMAEIQKVINPSVAEARRVFAALIEKDKGVVQ